MLLYNAKIFTTDTGLINPYINHTIKSGCIENGYLRINDDGLIADIGDMDELGVYSMTQSEKTVITKNKKIIRGAYDPADVDGSIARAKLAIANNDDRINMSGLALYPGFIDAHCHLGTIGNGLGIEGDDVNECTDPCTPHLRAIDDIDPSDYCFEEAINAGVTTVVTGVGSANPIGGSMLLMRTYGENIIESRTLNPQIGIKFALGENPKNVYRDKKVTPTTRMGTVSIIRQMLYKTKEYMENKARGEKVPFDMKCEALVPLLKGEVSAHFHCHRADDIATARRIAQEFNLKYVLVHATEGYLVDGLVPPSTNCIVGPIISDRSKPELLHQSITNAAKLFEAGANICICTDHPVVPIQYLPLSAGIAVRGGLSEKEALSAISINPAKLCGIDKDYGSLSVGKHADIVAIRSTCKFYNADAIPEFVLLKGKLILTNNNVSATPIATVTDVPEEDV